MQNQTTLTENPNFKTLNEACEVLKKVYDKTNKLMLALGFLPPIDNQLLHQKQRELQKLHREYKALLEWLQQPENEQAKSEFAEHWTCAFLNSFFSA